jgi:hypothetical protein
MEASAVKPWKTAGFVLLSALMVPLALRGAAVHACPGNLLEDAGFEAGDLAAWSALLSGDPAAMLVTAADGWEPAEGAHAVRFHARMTDDVLSIGQEVPLLAGVRYRLVYELLLTGPVTAGAVAVAVDGEWIGYLPLPDIHESGAWIRTEILFELNSQGSILTVENPFLDGADILIDNLCLAPFESTPPVITAVQVQMTINAALGLPVEPGFQADANGDGKIDAVDVQLMINAALGLP